jgi:TonB-linked SusC/RagA family outer membrane protein
MKKIRDCYGRILLRVLPKKIIRVMKLTLFLTILTISQLWATESYSQKTRLNLKLEEVKISDVLKEIENQSEFYFLYSPKLIDVERKVSVDAKNESIKDILINIFDGEVKFVVYDRQIILSKNDVTGLPDAMQQQKILAGTVTDKNGTALPGVNVVVTGTTVGKITDVAGKYSIEIPQGSKSLTFTFIGMVPQEINIGSLNQINVTMIESSVSLEEVVVVGYGTAKKVTMTGSVASVTSKDLNAISTDNLSTNLAGKLPGLRVTQRTGEPGAFTTIFDIRGYGTPLIVIDGIVSSQTDFVRLNPNDVEQISILKDASAAVYVVQAANGVILLTTKKGEIGKPKITYQGSYTLSHYIMVPKVCDAYGFALLTTQNEINSGRAPNATTYSPEDLQKYKDGSDPVGHPSVNWFDAACRKYTYSKRNNITISGGSDRIKYFTSIAKLYEMGLWKSGDMNYTKYNARTAVTGKISDNLEAEISMEGMMDDRHETYGAQGFFEVMFLHGIPTGSVYANNNPNYYFGINGINSVQFSTASQYGYVKTSNKSFQGIATLNYKVPFVKGLSAKFMYGYYLRDNYVRSWSKQFNTYYYDPVTDKYYVTGTTSQSVYGTSTMRGNYSPFDRSTLDLQLTYDKVFSEKHAIKFSLVYEDRHDLSDNLNASKQMTIPIDQFYAGVLSPTVTSSNIGENDNQSIIGRFNYDYLSKYLVEVGFNYGGSSKFPAGKRWGFFPYSSIGWRVSQEDFFKNAFPSVTNFKLRGSYGIMGDDAASTFQFLTGYNYPSGNYIIDDKTVSGLGFRGMPNPNISWFTVASKNIGFDASYRNGLINLSVDLFRRDRSGLLSTRVLTIPASVGAALPQENLNKDMREGLEIVLGHSRQLGELKYDISGTFTYTRGQNTLIERAKDANTYLNWRNNTTNRWTNIAWGYNCVGQFQNQDDLNNSPIQDSQGNRTLRPGDIKYEDINGDGEITALDQLPIARGTVPDITFSLNGGLTYKQFDLNLLLQGATNYNHARTWYFRGPLPWNRNSLTILLDNWHHQDIYDVNSPWVPGKYPSATTQGTPPSNQYDSQFWVQNARYLRLKSMEIGYSLKKSLLSKLLIQNLRIYVSGFNLFTWSEMKDFDPEILNDASYPIFRDISFGVNLTF